VFHRTDSSVAGSPCTPVRGEAPAFNIGSAILPISVGAHYVIANSWACSASFRNSTNTRRWKYRRTGPTKRPHIKVGFADG
jgi:hypothetical protein